VTRDSSLVSTTDKEVFMFGFEQRWTWLVPGLSLTVAVVIVLLAAVVFVEWSEQRTQRPRW
jgi:hypothetical protein